MAFTDTDFLNSRVRVAVVSCMENRIWRIAWKPRNLVYVYVLLFSDLFLLILQVEYYFSDENLPNDKYMLGFVKKNKEGFGKGFVSWTNLILTDVVFTIWSSIDLLGFLEFEYYNSLLLRICYYEVWNDLDYIYFYVRAFQLYNRMLIFSHL